MIRSKIQSMAEVQSRSGTNDHAAADTNLTSEVVAAAASSLFFSDILGIDRKLAT